MPFPDNASDAFYEKWTLNVSNHLQGGLPGDVGQMWSTVGYTGFPTWMLQASGQVSENVGEFALWSTDSLASAFVQQPPQWNFNWSRCIRVNATRPDLCGGSGWVPHDPNLFILEGKTSCAAL